MASQRIGESKESFLIRQKEDSCKWRKAHLNYHRKWQKSHKEKIKEYGLRYRESHKEEISERSRKYYHSEYYKIHQEEIKERCLRYYKENVENCKRKAREYLQTPNGKASMRKHAAKRRSLGFIPLNNPFENSHGHHVDLNHVIYIPINLHQNTYHNIWTGENMSTINEKAFEFLEEGTN